MHAEIPCPHCRAVISAPAVMATSEALPRIPHWLVQENGAEHEDAAMPPPPPADDRTIAVPSASAPDALTASDIIDEDAADPLDSPLPCP